MSTTTIDFSMLAIFRADAESQLERLTAGLLALERNATAKDQLEASMRAAHSLKGACRMVGLAAGVEVAHGMEDCFVAAQQRTPDLDPARIDLLLKGVDLLTQMARASEAEIGAWAEHRDDVEAWLDAFRCVGKKKNEQKEDSVRLPAEKRGKPTASETESSDRVLRVTADNLNRFLGLAGESVVASRRLKPFSESLLRMKRLHHELANAIEALGMVPEQARSEVKRRVIECQDFLSQRMAEVNAVDRQSANLASRLYDEALAIRMRPFSDGVQGLQRFVRDLAQSLGKRARLEIMGESTQVDRDILEKLKAPLDHLLRNAVDHGVETPAERRAAGKAEEALIVLEARHKAGMLQITVADDGHGIDLDRLRETVVKRNLATEETVSVLSEAELLEFLFLPGFTTKEEITEISGRGVGLDVVRNMMQKVHGTVRVSTRLGAESRFQLQLPLTLSVVRSLLAQIGGEPYAFPLVHVVSTMKVAKDKIESLEGRPHTSCAGRRVGLIAARQLLGGTEEELKQDELPVIVVGEGETLYGLVIDRFLGERELVVQPLDRRLGKMKDIAAGALMENGAPILVVDTEDLVRSIEKLAASGRPEALHRTEEVREKIRKRILVVDDSLTVRELERKVLSAHGYEVEVAVDGMDGWNAVRMGHFDLVVSDIDMPRLDGIELVTLIKRDPNLRALPVMIVSYKEREEDRRRGLEAGADYYLTKGSFQDEKLLQAVIDLIGEANVNA